MKHLLPDLEHITRANFIFIDETDWETFSIPAAFDVLFVQKPSRIAACPFRLFSAAKKQHTPLSDVPFLPAEKIQSDDPWPSVCEKVSKNSYLLVCKKKAPIGFIRSSELAALTLNAYIYLKAYYDTILDTTDSSISVIDENLKTVVWTSGAEKLFSIKKEQILGKPMTDFFPSHRLENRQTIKSGEKLRHKQHQPREDLFVLLNSSPVYVDDKIAGVVTSETDVTSQVLLNQELQHANKKIRHLENKVTLLDPSADPFYPIKGSSQAIKQAIDKVRQIGSTRARVLFLGESGVGKELFAKALHDIRSADQSPFIAVNCGAIPPSLFESELFGYERGAFSGASSQGKKGKFEMARGGSLFLDEIGELPLELQVKLLRVLQDGSYYPVGGTKQKRAECSIIAATNRDLKKMVDGGTFRADLFYRLNTVSVYIPPLRERIEDIVELSHLFLYEFSVKYNRQADNIPKDVMIALLNYSWPGNIRELRNAIERLVIFSKNGRLDPADLPFSPDLSGHPKPFSPPEHSHAEDRPDQPIAALKDSLETFEEKIIRRALRQTHGNKNKAAEKLNISRATLYNKMNKLGI